MGYRARSDMYKECTGVVRVGVVVGEEDGKLAGSSLSIWNGCRKKKG
jgi:hypothetical protein